MVCAFPPGTTADRVEEVRGPDGWRVADVRGETLTADGGRFHLLRPEGAALTGYAWSRDEPAHDRWVHETLAEAIVMGDMASDGMASDTREGVASGLRARGDCARCHGANRPADLGPRALVHRETDPQGWYVPASVLADGAPLERYRPDDPNEGPFVIVRCQSGEAERVSIRGGRRWRCPAGDIPWARFDVAAALAAGDPHAEAVCASRRWLAEHMSERARLHFAAAWAACRASRRSR